MSRKYKIRDQAELYFVTFTVINWIDLFIRDAYRDVLVDSMKYEPTTFDRTIRREKKLLNLGL